MAVIYEWDVEELEAPDTGDNDPEILDHNHCGSYAEAKSIAAELEGCGFYRIVLIRDVGNNLEGLTDRAWAYLKPNGTLPTTFTYGADEDSGILVPKRYHAEVAR